MEPSTLRSVVVATDLSTQSDAALRTAAAIAELTGAALHVVHAYELEAVRGEAEEAPATFPERVATAERRLDAQIAREVPASVPVASRCVEVYLPEKAILERARAVSADLIVLGRHRGGASRAILGTTADHVVHASVVPCLVAPGAPRLPLRTVVAPMDPSKPAPAVAQLALAWASSLGTLGTRPPGTALHLLAVLPEETAPKEGLEVTVQAALEEALAPEFEAARAPRNVAVQWAVSLDDSPAAGILRYAGDVDADLLVLGTSAPGAVRRIVLGSVASAVAKASTHPVLLVPMAQLREHAA
ncbi:MAG TPA: universal stress protein [Longimicrobiales bacterium]